MTDGHQGQQRPLRAAAGSRERPVLPTGALGRTGRLALLPLRHAARTAAAASRLSRAATDQVAARTAEQVFATLGELKGGAAKLGQAMSVFEAAMPEEVAAPYRSALRRLTDAAPAMPAEVAHRVLAADLAVVYGLGWQDRLVAFDDIPAAAASIGQVHRGQWRMDGGQVVQVAVKVQYPGVGQALRSDLRQARLLARVAARLTRLNVSGLADELAGRIAEELDYVREGRVQAQVAAAFAHRLPKELAAARAAGAHEPPGRTSVTVPAVYAGTPRVLITRWLDGAPLSALLDGRTDLLPGRRHLHLLPRVAVRAHDPPHPAALRPGVARPDAAAAVRTGLAGHALSRRALRAARRHRSHPRVPPGLLPRVPRQHPPSPAPANRRHTPPRQLNNRHPKHEQKPPAAESGADPSWAALTSEYRIAD